ncbi:esterase/lipase family protein [Singulisphaera sp. PoT]|uniref:esterase/lipase family protein n=1 Tax=Singulisphaera sp. PoT TaxID=3411797 RepID=UPI003BF48EAF
MLALLIAVACSLGGSSNGRDETNSRPLEVRIALEAGRDLDVGQFVVTLGQATGIAVVKPEGSLSVPVAGVGGGVSRNALEGLLGPAASLSLDGKSLVVSLDRTRTTGDSRADWIQRLRKLAEHVEQEARREAKYGMRARPSYRPNDPGRPTICLVHGLNSSSGGFVHMIPPLEAAGFGVVVFDYPFNRELEDSCDRFRKDWAEFRHKNGETRPWAIVAHSMGALVSRSYVETDGVYDNDVSDLILIAPVNQGSSLAKIQTLLQLLDSVRAVRGNKHAEALSHLGDGLGEAAKDILPGSRFLKALNKNPRRAGVRYRIIAGDVGFVTREMRAQVESRMATVRKGGGLLGGLVRLASAEVEDQLDEVSDGTGDGCVTVERTKLPGVVDHVTIHANHAELIRAPLLFRDPGPVACMPYLLKWLPARTPAAASSSPP